VRARRTRLISACVILLVLVMGTRAIAAPFGSRSLYTGRIGTDVAELQRRLNSLGYSAGTADGIFGSRTRAALSQFQQDAGLVADGVAEQWDFQALNRATAYRLARPYTVAEGESLAQIAAANGTTKETLIWLNQLSDAHVTAGQVIRIPAPEAVENLPPAKAPTPPPAQDPPHEPIPQPPAPQPPTTQPPPAQPPDQHQPPVLEQPAPPTPTATGPGTVSAVPAAPAPAQPSGQPEPTGQPEPQPDAPEPMPGHRWILPGLTLLDNLVVDPPPPVAPQPGGDPQPARRPLVVGYYAEDWQGDTAALTSLRAAGPNVDIVVNFQFQVDARGNLATRPYPELLTAAREKGVKVYGLVHNYVDSGFSSAVAAAVLGDPTARKNAVEQIWKACQLFGLAGIDIDIENVPPSQRENYTAFVRELAERLKPEGYAVSLSVPAKTGDDAHSAWTGAYDYAALGQYADRVAVMAYDEHTPGFAAGPIASIGWTERVAAYAASQIEPKKVLLGIAAYGYDWVAGTTVARALSVPQAEALAARTGAKIEWDAEAQVPCFTYLDHGTQRIVYYENAASTATKLNLVQRYGLGGIAIWRLGLESPSLWPVIQEKLR
jgi:spore germination protein